MVCYTTSKAENKAIIYSNHLLYNQQSYSYLNIEKHPLCYKKSKSIDFTNLKYKSKSIFYDEVPKDIKPFQFLSNRIYMSYL